MKSILVFLFFFISFNIGSLNAQIKNEEAIILGRVADVNNRPLAAVTIREIGTNNLTQTDEQGEFNILVSSLSASLSFTLLGYFPYESPVKAEKMQINLNISDRSLEEVVITGLQQLDKRKFTGSVAQVDRELIDRSGAVDVSRMLQGVAAGVSVQNVSGTFGATPKIRIRGNSSISANQEPLYVVNGVPITTPANVNVSQLYSGDPATLLGSAISGINAQDIEDIVILKDGAATALYGTRAANGVISITTRSGALNTKQINYSSSLSLGLKPRITEFNVMNSAQEMEFYQELYDKGYLSNSNWPSRTGAFTDAYRRYGLREINLEEAYAEIHKSAQANTDWFDVLFRNNILQEHNISFSGGGESNQYYLSAGYVYDDGQAIGFGMNRFTTDFRTILKINPRFNLDLNINWSHRNQKTPGTAESATEFGEVSRRFDINPTAYAMQASRSMYPYEADGSYKYYLNNFAPFNIVEEMQENFVNLYAQEIRALIRPSYQISKSLRYEGSFSIRHTHNGFEHIMTELSNVANAYRVDYNDVLRESNNLLYRNPTDPFAYFETILPRGGFINRRANQGTFYNLRSALNFREHWDAHSLDLTVGGEVNRDRVETNFSRGIGYLYYGGQIVSPSALALIQSVQLDQRLYEENFTHQNQIGYYVSAQYSFKDRYNFESSGRLDASNVFGRLARSKFLPNYSFGLSWNVNQEEFFKNWNSNRHIDFLKLRTSYALRGLAFQGSPMLNSNFINRTRLDDENSEISLLINSPELFNLNWERDYIGNIGLELGLWNRVNLVAEYYHRENRDLITSINIAQEEGFNEKTINYGSMRNRGIDLTLGFRDLLDNTHFKWNLNLIYGYVKNDFLSGELESSLLTSISRSTGYPLIGGPYEGLYGFRFARLDADGRPLFYQNGEEVQGIISSETDRAYLTYLGSRQPLSTGSIANSFNYKGFEFRVFLTYSTGHFVPMTPIAALNYEDDSNVSADLVYRFRQVGDELYTDIPGILSSIQRLHLRTVPNIDELAYNRSDLRVANASNLRVSELMFSYDLNPQLLNRIKGFKSARVMLSANNIYYWASDKLRGVDPDLLLNGGVTLPNPRSFSFRILASF